MKTYTNTVVINGIEYTNKIIANDYKEALIMQKQRSRTSKNTFKGRLKLN